MVQLKEQLKSWCLHELMIDRNRENVASAGASAGSQLCVKVRLEDAAVSAVEGTQQAVEGVRLVTSKSVSTAATPSSVLAVGDDTSSEVSK